MQILRDVLIKATERQTLDIVDEKGADSVVLFAV